MSDPVRVLVVDDSPFMRYTLAKHLSTDPNITVVGSAQDGLDALNKIPVLSPDVITLDVEMPRMDGLTALERIMSDCPRPVVMLSSLTHRGTRTTIQALMRGAVDFVAKPTTSTDIRSVVAELSGKIIAAAGSGRNKNGSASQRQPLPERAHLVANLPGKVKPGLQPFKEGNPVVVIGTSTGGPRALQQVLTDLPGDLAAAVVVVQHMPAGFTKSLANRLNEISALNVQEAAEGDRLALGLVLLAPGDFHLCLQRGKKVRLDHGPRRNHVRPAVDVTMESAVEQYKSAVIGVVLTGMGSDGVQGAGCIKQAGGRVVAEHESTSVVYGMPRSIVEAKLADYVVPLPEIASKIVDLVNNGNMGI